MIAPTSNSFPNDQKFPDSYTLLPGGNYRIAPYASSAFYECIKHGYGISINTASNDDPVKDPGREVMLNTLFSNATQFLQPAGNGLKDALIYGAVSYTQGNSIYQYRVSDKSGAM